MDDDRRPDSAVDPSSWYLFALLAVIEGRVRKLVDLRRSDDPTPDDPFRGLYLSDERVDRILAEGADQPSISWDDAAVLVEIESAADRIEMAGTEIRLRSLAARAGLDSLDLHLLLIALAPDLDVRFERLYGYLNDDVTRRRATINLAFELAGTSPWLARARARLSADGPLIATGLVEIESADGPYLSRSLRVPDGVAGRLLGGDTPDHGVTDLIAFPSRVPETDLVHSLARAIREGVTLIYLREEPGASAASVAAAGFELADRTWLAYDLNHASPSVEASEIAGVIRREGLLRGAGVIAGPVEALAERERDILRVLVGNDRLDSPAGLGDAGVVPIVLFGQSGWDPAWCKPVPLIADVSPHTATGRLQLWQNSLGAERPSDLDGSDVTDQFLLSADQVKRAVTAARLQASLEGELLSLDHLRYGARSQNGAAFERLSRRIHPRVTWDDLVLDFPTESALRALASRARHRSKVLDEWGMRPGGGRGRGIAVLFAGDSGTGKTMSAEVVAGALGLDLYTVNLATVVDKYVGETEKNLERIFTAASGVNAVLLFDEADAIFGKRSEVKDSNDRYGNIEVAYLLQRMETFDGIAILATNLRANVDEAFTRRLDLIVDFPMPDVDQRRLLWERCLSDGLPRDDDLDLDFCAHSFELSGGNIRSASITAAYRAAENGSPVSMLDLVKSIQEEYQKLGRLVVPGEFGRFFPLLQARP